MRRLLLLRHAKSSWGQSDLPDRERPLAPRGERAAALMAAEIAQEFLPDRVLCSPARRARETLAPLLPRLGGRDRVRIEDGLYEPPSGDYRTAIAAGGGGAATLLVVGHNPSIQRTALALLGRDERGLQSELAHKFPTGALAVIDLDLADWAELGLRGGTLARFVTPRSLAQGREAEEMDD